MKLKEAFKQELPVSIAKLKEKGAKLLKQGLEDIAMESADLISRVAVISENKIDDFFQVIKGMLVKELDKIDGEEG